MKLTLPSSLFVAALASAVLAQAQTPTLLADINPGDGDSKPTRFYPYGDLTLFRAESAEAGVEPWVTDGTPEGTMMLADLNSDPDYSRGNSNPDNWYTYGGLVYFKARGNGIGDELYVTDGTPAGTRLVKNIYEEADPTDPESSGPLDFIAYDGLLYFTARTAAESSELWVTDGTTDGTRLAVDINPGEGTGIPNFKAVYNGLLYFSANDGTSGAELFRSDGTPEGTELVADVNEGSGNGRVSNLYVHNGLLYFTANDGDTGTELYRTDGTAAGTAKVIDLSDASAGSRPDNFLTLADSFLVFSANAGDGEELFYLTGDGTAATRINDGGTSDVSVEPDQIVPVIENLVYAFVAESGDSSAVYVLSLDGAPERPSAALLSYLYRDIDAGDIQDLTFSGSHLYFTYESEATGREIAGFDFAKERDGAALGEVGAGAIDGEVDDLTLVGDRLVFEATDGSSGLELYAVDARTAYVSLDFEGEEVTSGDTIALDTIAIGDTGLAQVDILNVGNDTAILVETQLLGATRTYFVGVTNDAIGPFLPQGEEQQAYGILFEPEDEGPALDSFLVAFTTAGGDGYRKLYLTATVVTASLVVTDSTDAGEVIARGETVEFVGDGDTEQITRRLVLSNGGLGNLNVVSARMQRGEGFAVSGLDAVVIGRGSESIDVTWTRDNAAAGALTDTLLIRTTLPGADSLVRVPVELRLLNAIVENGLSADALYPNPVSAELQVELADAIREGTWTVTNAAGQRVVGGGWPHDARNASLDLSALPTGVYQLEVRSGERSLVAQIVKR